MSLTPKELIFIEALKNDLEINGEKSFIEILFQSSFKNEENMRIELDELFEGYYKYLFDNYDLIFEAIGLCYIGKYKDTFWGTGSEGEIFGLGKEIQNIVFPLILSEIGQVSAYQEKLEVEKYFKKYHNLNYDEYIQSYKDFCKSFGYEYQESLEVIQKQSEEFEKELPLLY